MIEARSARFADALFLADRLRFEDAREIAGVWGVGARQGLFLCLLHSDRAFALLDHGQPVALCGVTGSNYAGLRIGIPWLLAGERLFANRRWVVRSSRSWIDYLLLDYDVLSNLTDAANAVHLRWLAWCGFLPLRDIQAYGRAGRPFREFYRVNPHRPAHPDSVRDLLLARRVPGVEASADSPVGHLAQIGIDLLADTVAAPAEVLTSLAQCLNAMERLPAEDGAQRSKRATVRLLQEAAPGIVAAAAADAADLGAWCEALAEVGVVCTLEAGLEPADVVLNLLPRRVPRRLLEAAAGRGRRQPVTGGGDVREPFRQMVHHYHRTLTLGHRVDAIHGYRLHAAALGITDDAVMHPLGVPRADVEQLMAEHYVGEFLWWRGSRPHRGIAAARVPLCEGALSHSDVLARVSALAGRHEWGGGCLGGALRAMLDRWVAGGCSVRCLADAVTMAATLAHGIAQQRLPGLRLGGMDSAYAERHGLYRLLRLGILLAAVDQDVATAAPLLLDEVAGLVVVRRLDSALLAQPPDPAGPQDHASLLLDHASAIWGPAIAGDDDLAYLCGVLAPGMLVPVAHGIQLPPALLAWHLAVSGALPEALAEVGEILADERRNPRGALRKFLRRCYAEVGMVGLRQTLKFHAANPAAPASRPATGS